jgi:twitching motility protein PilT
MTLASVISQRLIPKLDGGRLAAREIMINTPAVSNLIREAKIAQVRSVLETSSKEGMHSMDQDLQRLYKEKKISKEEAQMHMENPEVLEKFKLI